MFLCVSLPSEVFPQNIIKPLKGFSVLVPDTVTQGEDFTVSYVLEATHWINAQVRRGTGLILKDSKPNLLEGRPYRQLTIQTRLFTTRIGHITLPPMVAEIDGQEVVSEQKVVYVKPHPRYGAEMTVAQEWLLKKGVSPDSLSFNFTAQVGQFYFFSDLLLKCFCLVADKDTWPYAGNPVWAWSMECGMDAATLNDFLPYFITYYSNILSGLTKSKGKVQTFSGEMDNVSPLLGELSWGQDAPYNSKLPVKDGKHVITGCVPVSMAMVMKFHEWPHQGKSNLCFKAEGKTYVYDCTELRPQWEHFRNHYDDSDTEACADLSKLLAMLGFFMNPTYSESGTSANLDHLKHVMCNNLGYSGRMSVNDDLPDKDAFQLLSHELQNHRPCIVSRNAHAFICDGYEDGFFHYNMGWKGHGNGYFRAVVKKDGNFLKRIVTGILPQREELTKEVALTEAGTLDELLSDEEKENLVALKVSGPLGSSDILLLRAMTGAKDDSPYDSRHMGSLRDLDLSQATVMSDETPFRTRKATGTYSGKRTQTETRTKTDAAGNKSSNSRSSTFEFKFDFSNMNLKQWEDFRDNYADKARKKGLAYSRLSDREYVESSFCVENTIGTEMFAGCSSLRSIELPLVTKAIQDHAFKGCTSLQSIRIPASVTECGKRVFQDCLSLEKIFIPVNQGDAGAPDFGASFLGSNLSPGIEIEQY